jgi:two-component system response regulator YesN
MQVLIVEDDIPTSNVIKNYIRWDTLSIDKVDIANTVEAAKQLMLLSPAQIVLSDIEMPDGSGIDLLDWINSKNFKTKVIFLTCHSSFSFASAAVSGHAFYYLVKPFKTLEVEAVLAKAVNSINKEQKLETLRVESLKHEFWRKLIFRELGEDPNKLNQIIEEKYADVKPPMTVRPILASIPVSYTSQKWNDDVFSIAFNNLVSSIANDFDVRIQTVTYIRHECHYCMLIAPSELSFSTLRNCMERIMNSCKDQLDSCCPSCYIDKVCAIHNLPQSRKKMQVYDSNNVAGRGKLFSGISIDGIPDATESVIDTEELLSMMQHFQLHQVISTIGDLLRELNTHKSLSYEVLSSIRLDYQQVLYTFLLENDLRANELFFSLQSIENAAGTSMVDLLKWVSLSAEKAINTVKENNQYSETTIKMILYMKDHCKENPSLREVADSVCLSPDYASRIFKSDTGVNVKEYLNHARIEKAMKLLRVKGQNISSVAYETGFKNSSYFSTIFKQITGVSPTIFLNQNRGEH